MSYIYEVIKFNDALPVKIFIHQINNVQSHWHESIEILFVTKGSVELVLSGKLFNLKEDDLIIINSKEIHSVKSNEENTAIALQIDLNKLDFLYEGIDKINFDCKSFEYKKEDDRFNLIRSILAQIIYFYMKENNGYKLKINSLLNELIYIIVNRFKSNVEDVYDKKSYKHLERLDRVITYLKENYNKEITLSNIAKMEYLSPQYFSKFFEKHMGVNFLTYLNSLRLDHAVKDLISTDYNIIDIASNNGFANVKSFTHLFKISYNDTPSNYRKKLYNANKLVNKNENKGINYFEFNANKHMDFILKYINNENKSDLKNTNMVNKIDNSISVDLDRSTKKLNHSWKSLITIGKAKEGLFNEVQKQLIEIQNKIGFKYIRFHGIFDDDMMVYDEDENGNLIFNYTYIDRLFDFLLSIKLKPFLELGFMPSKLALDKNKKMFYTNSIISKPKKISLWNELVEKLIEHCINRYGMAEVLTWHFEVWNEPDIESAFGFEENYYYEFFKETYKTIKNINDKLKVGGPSILGYTILKNNWMDEYIKYCIDNKCRPDFISFHSYPIGCYQMNELLNQSMDSPYKGSLFIDSNEGYLKELIIKLKKKLKKYELDKIEIYMTEWNSTASHRDLTNDTLYKSSYVCKNILENIDTIDGFGYWVASDLIEESIVENDIFHGGLGMITTNGIKKPAYYAYELLSRLGNELIEQGDGYFITKNFDEYEIMIYNYCHFDNIYLNGDTSHINKYNRYEVFRKCEKCISIELNNLKSSNYLIREYTISKDYGSAYDTWIKMNHPNYIDEEDVTYINNNSTPKIKKYNEYIKKKYCIRSILESHEVKIYTIKPIY
ncbi:GH39 family glycosyl hydrolase [Terrisporobacter mayombei]|uniref:HTH-type transcriptional activator RhaS n=1 Tax=Terrisporobacter mayombei TaxID=1541 RepID=A0ABY9Q4Z3_9FIRM|nr:helix-turn-helix domain-containing protein [Terrisporobacter mayombei]MCC3868899.1 helix-turn-helix domain-containing protein [Terrisporobacter mayombei]WMT82967.1 HTH-type transcriptional activator RhaS [Terrisporobacter mayombei]